MGMGPIYNQTEHPAVTAANLEQQEYMQQFNNAAYAPIPGLQGQQTMPPPALTFIPPMQGMPGQGMPNARNHMVQYAPPVAMSGRYGTQASQMAGLLGQPFAGSPGGTGLLGGRPRGFRIPGGK